MKYFTHKNFCVYGIFLHVHACRDQNQNNYTNKLVIVVYNYSVTQEIWSTCEAAPHVFVYAQLSPIHITHVLFPNAWSLFLSVVNNKHTMTTSVPWYTNEE